MNLTKSMSIFLLSSLLCVSLLGSAQQPDTLAVSPKNLNSIRKGFVDRMQDFAKVSAGRSKTEFQADKDLAVQLRIFEEVRLTIQEAKSSLKIGFDTLALRAKLTQIQQDYKTSSDGVFTNKGTSQTYRNSTATKKIIAELLAEAGERKMWLDDRRKTLNGFRYRMDSLVTAPELFNFPKDSVELVDYLNSLITVAYETKPVDSVLKISGKNVQRLLNSYNLIINQLRTSIEEIEQNEQQLAHQTFAREFSNLWQPSAYSRTFSELLKFSWIKALLTLKFYVENNIWKLLSLIVLTALSFFYIRSLKLIYKAKRMLNDNMEGQLVLRYPILSAILLVISLFQFILISPPFILNVLLWLVSCICLTIIFRGYITRYWMVVWLLMVGLFTLASLDNLILQASRMERWFMLFVAFFGFVSGIVILVQRRQNQLREKWIGYGIAFMVFLEFLSVLANLFGRYNVSKTLFIGGFLNVVVAIIFLWVVRFINEGLVLAFDVYTVQDRKLFYLNFGKVGNRAPLLLYILLVLGWIILMGHNFPLFEYLSKPLLSFMGRNRTIGEYTFSINGLLLFFVIMSISVVVSKIVSFFASDDHLAANKEDQKTKRGLGSWILLVRIFILSMGLFLAIAAAGIPMDRITIIIGALGVGIGFGLQTLVNNLVSGLIIAFEKPVNVGDIVDVDGQGGTMKSIGFRSSVITTWDGADLVMPNGDLLNSHLMNWTLAGNRKRVSISIGVSYGSDLDKCRKILLDILDHEERVLKSPVPSVHFEQLASSSIDLIIYFWTKNMKDNNPTKSDLLITIQQTFSRNGIVIPYPQQEVYLHIDKSAGDGQKKD